MKALRRALLGAQPAIALNRPPCRLRVVPSSHHISIKFPSIGNSHDPPSHQYLSRSESATPLAAVWLQSSGSSDLRRSLQHSSPSPFFCRDSGCKRLLILPRSPSPSSSRELFASGNCLDKTLAAFVFVSSGASIQRNVGSEFGSASQSMEIPGYRFGTAGEARETN